MGFSPPKAMLFLNSIRHMSPQRPYFFFRNFWSEIGWSQRLKTGVDFTELGMVLLN